MTTVNTTLGKLLGEGVEITDRYKSEDVEVSVKIKVGGGTKLSSLASSRKSKPNPVTAGMIPDILAAYRRK